MLGSTAASTGLGGLSRSKHHRQQHRDRGGNFRTSGGSSSSVIGCEASHLHHISGSHSNFDDIKEEVALARTQGLEESSSLANVATMASNADEPQGQPHQHRLETHSCPR